MATFKQVDSRHKEEVGKTGDLNYSGYFDWNGLYAVLTQWARQNLLKIYEPLYKDKVNKEGFTERELEWYLERKVDRMNKYKMKIAFKMWDCQEVEVTQNGVTKKLTRGRFRMRLEAFMDRDYQGVFDKGIWRRVWRIYDQAMEWDWGFKQWNYWYDKMYELQALVKNFLGIDTR